MTEVSTINIKPEMGMYRVLKHLKYKSWFAIAEFVDNSLQSFIAKDGQYGETRRQCVLEITYNPNENFLIIADNAYGILETEHSRAFTAGIPPKDATGLSEFGVGMKAAGIWFSPDWKVITNSIDSQYEYEYSFKLDELVLGSGDITPTIRPISSQRGYTRIVLNCLHHKIAGRTLGKIKQHLTSIYRCFLRSKQLVIFFNGEALEYQEPEILVAPPAWEPDDSAPAEWKKTISITLSNRSRVTGFVAIREKGSLSHAGLSLFRRNRVIMGTDDDKYRPKEIFKNPNSYEYQRIFGELHLVGFDVSHTKDSFNFGEYEEEFLDKLKESIESQPLPLLRQADKYRSKKLDKATGKILVDIGSRVAQHLGNSLEHASSDYSNPLPEPEIKFNASRQSIPQDLQENSFLSARTDIGSAIADPGIAEISKQLQDSSEFSFSMAGIRWKINFNLDEVEPNKLYNISYLDEQSMRPESNNKNLCISLNPNHRLVTTLCDESPAAIRVMMTLIATLCATEILLTANGNSFARFIRKSFNELVSQVVNGMTSL